MVVHFKITEEEQKEKTPDELIEIGYKQIKSELSMQLLNQIKDCSPYFFEKLVIDLLIKMGYGGSEIENGQVTSKSADEGIEGKKLAYYMIENELGVSLKQSYKLYNIDTDYFIEEQWY